MNNNEFEKYLSLYSDGGFLDIRHQPQRANGYWIPIDVFKKIQTEIDSLKKEVNQLDEMLKASVINANKLNEDYMKLKQDNILWQESLAMVEALCFQHEEVIERIQKEIERIQKELEEAREIIEYVCNFYNTDLEFREKAKAFLERSK